VAAGRHGRVLNSMAFKLCYITDRHALTGKHLIHTVVEAVQAGVDLVQIREKDLETRELVKLAECAVEAAKGTGSSIIVNDRMDVALAVGAAGVHLGTQSIPVRAVGEVLKDRSDTQQFIVGASCHSLGEALEAESAGADYLLLGPIFETPSKAPYGPPLGLAKLQEGAARVKIPLLALGGISVDRVKACLEAGASGIAGIRIFQEAASLAARVRELRRELGSDRAASKGSPCRP
jgi:thiamine-phosphate pyrophosphorylase